MDAFVKSSNCFSYVLLFCQEANPSLSLSSQKHRERESKHKLLELPSLSLSLSLSRYSCFKIKKGNVQDLGFENNGKRKKQPARLFFKLKMLRGDIVVVCSFVYQDKLKSPLHL
jgi:hypothetical protein